MQRFQVSDEYRQLFGALSSELRGFIGFGSDLAKELENLVKRDLGINIKKVIDVSNHQNKWFVRIEDENGNRRSFRFIVNDSGNGITSIRQGSLKER